MKDEAYHLAQGELWLDRAAERYDDVDMVTAAAAGAIATAHFAASAALSARPTDWAAFARKQVDPDAHLRSQFNSTVQLRVMIELANRSIGLSIGTNTYPIWTERGL